MHSMHHRNGILMVYFKFQNIFKSIIDCRRQMIILKYFSSTEKILVSLEKHKSNTSILHHWINHCTCFINHKGLYCVTLFDFLYNHRANALCKLKSNKIRFFWIKNESKHEHEHTEYSTIILPSGVEIKDMGIQ